jgi:hypothetical protein
MGEGCRLHPVLSLTIPDPSRPLTAKRSCGNSSDGGVGVHARMLPILLGHGMKMKVSTIARLAGPRKGKGQARIHTGATLKKE